MRRFLTAFAGLAVLAVVALTGTARPASAAAWAWCSGNGGFMHFSDGLDLYNNVFGDQGPSQICGNSGSSWAVAENMPTGKTNVTTYPAVQKNYAHDVPVFGAHPLHLVLSTYHESLGANKNSDLEAAYDIWSPGNAQEIMLWVDNHGQRPAGTYVSNIVSGGHTWQLWRSGSTTSLVLLHNQTSGTIHILSALITLKQLHIISEGFTLHQLDFGYEFCSTGGQNETAVTSEYSLVTH
jgi:Glycosyl hydrolase family 12